MSSWSQAEAALGGSDMQNRNSFNDDENKLNAEGGNYKDSSGLRQRSPGGGEGLDYKDNPNQGGLLDAGDAASGVPPGKEDSYEVRAPYVDPELRLMIDANTGSSMPLPSGIYDGHDIERARRRSRSQERKRRRASERPFDPNQNTLRYRKLFAVILILVLVVILGVSLVLVWSRDRRHDFDKMREAREDDLNRPSMFSNVGPDRLKRQQGERLERERLRHTARERTLRDGGSGMPEE